MIRVLLFTGTAGYRHESIPAAAQAIRALPGLDVVHTEDPGSLDRLDDGNTGIDVVAFVSVTGDILDPPGRLALRHFVQRGGGFAAVHAAANAEPSSPRSIHHERSPSPKLVSPDRDRPFLVHRTRASGRGLVRSTVPVASQWRYRLGRDQLTPTS